MPEVDAAIVVEDDDVAAESPASGYGPDIYTEPEVDPDTLANLGPLRGLAGTWVGVMGSDQHPVAEGIGLDSFVERYDAQPIDGQTNGPQLLYGLRYHTHILRPGDPETFHDQVGYWLWEPATGTVTMTLAIPRGQVLLASGPADVDSTDFELHATAGSEIYGILSNPFLDTSFRTLSYRIQVTVGPDDTWGYEEEGLLDIPDRDEPFSHIDRNTLRRIANPTPNPMARVAGGDGSLGIGDLRHEIRNLP